MLVKLSVDVDSLQPGEKRPVAVDGRRLLLVRGDDLVSLVDAVCPHAGGDLVQGKVSGNRLQCPVHRYMFDLKTGGCAVARREGWDPLRVYDLREVDGQYCVEL